MPRIIESCQRVQLLFCVHVTTSCICARSDSLHRAENGRIYLTPSVEAISDDEVDVVIYDGFKLDCRIILAIEPVKPKALTCANNTLL